MCSVVVETRLLHLAALVHKIVDSLLILHELEKLRRHEVGGRSAEEVVTVDRHGELKLGPLLVHSI